MKIPRIIISATSSDSGKTLITTAILKILRKRGYVVQPFKVGPDYIDPMYLSKASERPCRNLDSWIMNENIIKKIFLSSCKGVDFAIIEGVRGLYESESPINDIGSTAHIAKILSTPVILVLNCHSLNRSAAAQVIGFRIMDKNIEIAGIILNNVKDSLHEEKIRRAIQYYTNVPILGVLYRSQELFIKKRHQGLITPNEFNINEIINKAAIMLEQNLEIEKLLEIMKSCPELNIEELYEEKIRKEEIKIGVFMDSAFSFYYYDNLYMLKTLGAEISIMNSLSQEKIDEDISGILIGGGYPELFAKELEMNQSLRNSLKKKIQDEMPIVGEGGGLTYLCKSINYNGKNYKMIGAFDGDVYFNNKPKVSYVELKGISGSPISKIGDTLRGHEFHYSYIENISSNFVFDVLRGEGIKERKDGALVHNTLGMYTQLHYFACPKVPLNFISACKTYNRK
ncbi:MAG: cobyrinate a,c-diamide synthase [Candidatus Methanomethylicaceae archaeon]|nr:hydrogenobyrinic acid a,c-diamide synthase (glutamine-hydrolyzing) [Candidatus Verstraetearchaeota archaeon]